MNEGSCDTMSARYECTCKDNYEGTNCERESFVELSNDCT